MTWCLTCETLCPLEMKPPLYFEVDFNLLCIIFPILKTSLIKSISILNYCNVFMELQFEDHGSSGVLQEGSSSPRVKCCLWACGLNRSPSKRRWCQCSGIKKWGPWTVVGRAPPLGSGIRTLLKEASCLIQCLSLCVHAARPCPVLVSWPWPSPSRTVRNKSPYFINDPVCICYSSTKKTKTLGITKKRNNTDEKERREMEYIKMHTG